MKKIGILVNDFPVTSETFIVNKVIGLLKHYEVVVFRANGRGDDKLFQLNQLFSYSNLTIVDVCLPFNKISLFIWCIQNMFSSLKLLKSKKHFLNEYRLLKIKSAKIQLLHVEYSGLAVEFLEALQKLAIPLVVSCRGSAEKVKLLTDQSRREGFQKVSLLASAMHCVSLDMKRTIAAYCSDEEKIFINTPAIDLDFFIPKENKVANEIPIVLSIGRFTFQKGYLLALLALKKVKESGLNFIWKIIGDGPQMEEIQFHVHALGLSNQVVLLGKQNKTEVNKAYQDADIFLLTSVYEGLPNVVLEAMAMQLPVIATNVGGVKEIIENPSLGLIAENYDVDALAAHLSFLIKYPQERKIIASNSRKQIEEKFSIHQQIEKFRIVYEQILEKNVV